MQCKPIKPKHSTTHQKPAAPLPTFAQGVTVPTRTNALLPRLPTHPAHCRTCLLYNQNPAQGLCWPRGGKQQAELYQQRRSLNMKIPAVLQTGSMLAQSPGQDSLVATTTSRGGTSPILGETTVQTRRTNCNAPSMCDKGRQPMLLQEAKAPVQCRSPAQQASAFTTTSQPAGSATAASHYLRTALSIQPQVLSNKHVPHQQAVNTATKTTPSLRPVS